MASGVQARGSVEKEDKAISVQLHMALIDNVF